MLRSQSASSNKETEIKSDDLEDNEEKLQRSVLYAKKQAADLQIDSVKATAEKNRLKENDFARRTKKTKENQALITLTALNELKKLSSNNSLKKPNEIKAQEKENHPPITPNLYTNPFALLLPTKPYKNSIQPYNSIKISNQTKLGDSSQAAINVEDSSISIQKSQMTQAELRTLSKQTTIQESVIDSLPPIANQHPEYSEFNFNGNNTTSRQQTAPIHQEPEIVNLTENPIIVAERETLDITSSVDDSDITEQLSPHTQVVDKAEAQAAANAEANIECPFSPTDSIALTPHKAKANIEFSFSPIVPITNSKSLQQVEVDRIELTTVKNAEEEAQAPVASEQDNLSKNILDQASSSTTTTKTSEMLLYSGLGIFAISGVTFLAMPQMAAIPIVVTALGSAIVALPYIPMGLLGLGVLLLVISAITTWQEYKTKDNAPDAVISQ